MGSVAVTGMLHDMKPLHNIANEIRKSVGDLSGIEVYGQQILVGIYLRGETTQGGIIMPGLQKEDLYQGKVVLILKMGPTATAVLQRDHDVKGLPSPFGARPPAVGDWVFHSASQAFDLNVKGPGAKTSPSIADSFPAIRDKGWPCRLVYAADLYGRVTDPLVLV